MYRLMDSSSIESLHGPLSGSGIIVLDEAIVVAPSLDRLQSANLFKREDGAVAGQPRRLRGRWLPWALRTLDKATYILVRNNLDILDVSCSLENLTQDFLSDPLV